VASAVFAGGADHHGTAVSQTGEFVVFQVVDLVPAEGPLEEAANASLESEVRIGMYGDFITAVRDEARMTINQQALQQVLALNTGQ
jgi:peptidyl-prolyl cis-trans isomerase D